MLSKPSTCLSLLLVLLLPSIAEAKKLPEWLTQARDRVISSELYEGEPDVIFIHDEGVYQVEQDGTILSTARQAMLIMNSAGAEEAIARVMYSEDSDKPLSIKAWMIPGKGKKGKVIEYKSKDVVDSVSAGPDESVITSSRQRLIDASGDAMSGWIFGFETVLRDRGTSPDLFWLFQGEHPSVHSIIELHLPDSWTYSTYFLDGNPVEMSRRNEAFVWETNNLAGVETQPMGVASPLAIGISLHAPKDERDPVAASWEELARRYWPFYDSRDELTEEMRQKVAELTAGVSDPVEQARVLCEYAQSINYVSISLELGKGGGFKPRSPDEVFSSNYGDCKDKSNLLTALLHDRGIEAYSLIVNWNESREQVREEWVSTNQFNHCVVALKVPDEYETPNVIEHQGLGRLLVFDPTNEFAVFGDLDNSLQGTKGMLLAGEQSSLVELPRLPLESRAVRREVRANIFLNQINGELLETSFGQQAASERSFAFTDTDNYQERVYRWLAESIPSVKVANIEEKDDRDQDQFTLSAVFASSGYGKNLRNRTLIFKPILVGRYEALPFGEEERTQSVRLNDYYLEETYELELPAGFELSEMPEDRSFAEDFGSYDLRFQHDAEKGTLHVERQVKILPSVIPLEQFPALEAFYRSRIKADQSVVVLEAI